MLERATARPFAVSITLGDANRAVPVGWTRRQKTAQALALRARIVLAAADGRNNCQIARDLGVALEAVRLWRRRWLGFAGVALADLGVAERLADAPRAGRPSRITAEQYCQVIALACAAPSASGRPISQWTGRELAAELVDRGIVERISPRHAARLLKRGTSSPTASGIG